MATNIKDREKEAREKGAETVQPAAGAATTSVDNAQAIDAALEATMQPSEVSQVSLKQALKEEAYDKAREIISAAEKQGITLDLKTPLQERLDTIMKVGNYSYTDRVFALAEENLIVLQVHREDCESALRRALKHDSVAVKEVLAFAEKRGSIKLDLPAEEVRWMTEHVISNCIHSYGIAEQPMQENIDFSREHNALPNLETIFTDAIQTLAAIGTDPDVQKRLIAFAKRNDVTATPTQENLQKGLIHALHHGHGRLEKHAKAIEEFAKKEYGFTLKWPS